MKLDKFVPRFGHFRGPVSNIRPEPQPLELRQIHALLTGPTLREITERIRTAPAGSPEQTRLKNTLPYITGAGVFIPKRADVQLTIFSRCILLDFDKVPDVTAARAALLADRLLAPALLLLFVSPRGHGLKAVFAADPGKLGTWPAPKHYEPSPSHTEAKAVLNDNFNALAPYLADRYGLAPDPAAKSLSQPCFLCYDPAAHLAPNA